MLTGLRAHVRANLVAYVALFFALSGTGAYASHLVVRSSDIVNGGVGRVDIANGAVNGAKIAAGSVQPSDRAAVPHIAVVQSDPQDVPHLSSVDAQLDEVELVSRMRLANDAVEVQTPGVYSITGEVRWSANDDGARSVAIRYGVNQTAMEIAPAVPTPSTATIQTVTTLRRLAVGDRVRLELWQSSGAPLTTQASVLGSPARLSLHWIGP